MDFKILFSHLAIAYTKLTKQQKTMFLFALVGMISFVLFLFIYPDEKKISNKNNSALNTLSSTDIATIKHFHALEDKMAQSAELSTMHQKYKHQEEKKKHKKIIQVVSPFVGGEHKVVAAVNIEYGFSTQNITRITAAVMVDGKERLILNEDGTQVKGLENQALDAADLAALNALICQSIGIDKNRGDEITLLNVEFQKDSSRYTSDTFSKLLAFNQTYIKPFSSLLEYIFAFLLLLLLYKKIIAPFAERMLEVSKEEELKKSLFALEGDTQTLEQKAQEMRQKIHKQLSLDKELSEEALKYEITLEKVKEMAENTPRDIASILEFCLSKATIAHQRDVGEKIAILLLQLGEDATSAIFTHMNVASVTEISKYIASEKRIDKANAAAILEEFYVAFQSGEQMSSGGIEYARELLYKRLGADKAKKIMDQLSQNIQKSERFASLSQVKPQELSEMIAKEHPQTIALILAHMDTVGAAETLEYFCEDLRSEVAMRLAKIGDISPSVLVRVAAVLESKIELLTSNKSKIGGIRAVADIFNTLSVKSSQSTLAKIEQVDEEMAALIREMMFTFEDMASLNINAIRAVLKSITKEQLMLALKSASKELKAKFFSAMGKRGAAAFEEKMQFLGAVKMKDVEVAQRKIIASFHALVENGTIEMDLNEEIIE